MIKTHHISLAGYTLLASLAAMSAAEPIDIGSRHELFVDHHLIERLDGVNLAWHRPQPREVAIRFDKP